MATTVFLDESGYTRGDLLNDEQPVFVLASHCFTEQESAELKQRFFGRVKAVELKYGQLARRSSRQAMILAFLRFIDAHKESLHFAYVHKRFALLCKAVDWIVEPVYRRQGLSLNERGGNLVLANILYHATADLAAKDYRHRLLASFYALMTQPCPETYTSFGDVIAEKCRPTRENIDNPLRHILGHLYDCLISLEPEDTASLGPENLDVTLAITLSLMHGWKQACGDTILVHDASSNMAARRDIWQALTARDVPETVVGWDRRRMHYPIQVRETQFVASPDSPGIQLADVLAGAISACLQGIQAGRELDEYEQELRRIIGEWECVEHIWPERKFTPQELGTVGPSFADPNAFVESVLDGLS